MKTSLSQTISPCAALGSRAGGATGVQRHDVGQHRHGLRPRIRLHCHPPFALTPSKIDEKKGSQFVSFKSILAPGAVLRTGDLAVLMEAEDLGRGHDRKGPQVAQELVLSKHSSHHVSSRSFLKICQKNASLNSLLLSSSSL